MVLRHTAAADAGLVLHGLRNLGQKVDGEGDGGAPARGVKAASRGGRAFVGLAAEGAERGGQGGRSHEFGLCGGLELLDIGFLRDRLEIAFFKSRQDFLFVLISIRH